MTKEVGKNCYFYLSVDDSDTENMGLIFVANNGELRNVRRGYVKRYSKKPSISFNSADMSYYFTIDSYLNFYTTIPTPFQGYITFETIQSNSCPLSGRSISIFDETQIIYLQTFYNTTIESEIKQNCTWNFIAPRGYGFKIVVLDFGEEEKFFVVNSTNDLITSGLTADRLKAYYNPDNNITVYFNGPSSFGTFGKNSFLAYVIIVKQNHPKTNLSCIFKQIPCPKINVINNEKGPEKLKCTRLKWFLPHNYTGYGYPNNAYCQKIIHLKPNEQLYATVNYLHSEMNVDIVNYFNGSEDVVGKRLEQKNVTVFFPDGNKETKEIKLKFESDGSVQGNGFNVELEIFDCKCGNPNIVIPCNGTYNYSIMGEHTFQYCADLFCNFTISINRKCPEKYGLLKFNSRIVGLSAQFFVISNGETILNSTLFQRTALIPPKSETFFYFFSTKVHKLNSTKDKGFVQLIISADKGPDRLPTVILTSDIPAYVLEFTQNNSAITIELSNDLKNANNTRHSYLLVFVFLNVAMTSLNTDKFFGSVASTSSSFSPADNCKENESLPVASSSAEADRRLAKKRRLSMPENSLVEIQLETLKFENGKLKQYIEELENQSIDECKDDKVMELENTILNLRETNKQMENQSAEAAAAVATVLQDNISHLRTIEALEKEKQEAEQKINELNAVVLSMKTVKSEPKEWGEDERKTSQGELDKLKAEINELKKKNESLELRNRELSKMESEVEAIKKAKEAAGKKIKDLEQDVQSAKAMKLSTEQKMEEKRKVYQSTTDKLKLELRECNSKITNMTESYEKLRDYYEKENKNLKHQIHLQSTKSNVEIDDLKKTATDLVKEKEALVQYIEKCKDEIEKLKNSNYGIRNVSLDDVYDDKTQNFSLHPCNTVLNISKIKGTVHGWNLYSSTGRPCFMTENSLKKMCFKLNIKGELIASHRHIRVNEILRKIHACELTKIYIDRQRIKLTDYIKLVSSGKIERCILKEVIVKDDDGKKRGFDVLLPLLLNIKKFEYQFRDSADQSEAAQELSKLEPFPHLQEFELTNLSESFKLKDFEGFIKKNDPGVRYSLKFLLFDKSEEHKVQKAEKRLLKSLASSYKISIEYIYNLNSDDDSDSGSEAT